MFVRASLRWYLVLGIALKVSLTWTVYAPVNSADPALLSGDSPSLAMHPVSPMSRLSWTLAGLPSRGEKYGTSCGRERSECGKRKEGVNVGHVLGRDSKMVRTIVARSKVRWTE